ncbi:MAG: Crp/Fnr family transcriptional regulator [Candidatus Binatia bacterium]
MIKRSIDRRAKTKRTNTFDPKLFLQSDGSGHTIVKHQTGETVFSQGSPADVVFYVLKGKVKLTVLSTQGKEAVVAIHGADEFFGEGCLTGQPRRLASAVALSDCEIMRLEKAAMIRALRKEPTFSQFFIDHLLTRTLRVEEDLVDQLFNSSERRLARTLLLLANFDKDGIPEPIIGKISHETLAAIVGTTRSRITSFMNKFRKLGLIDYNGQIQVHSSLLNVVLNDPHLKTRPELSGRSSGRTTKTA